MTRKASLPYPASPPPPPPAFPHQDPDSSASLVPDSADVPPIPSTSQRPNRTGGNFAFQDADNPWSDLPAKDLKKTAAVPDSRRSGPPPQPDHGGANSGSHALANIPQILRAGQSQDDTPRSSLDSQRSKDFWEDSDDEGQVEGTKSPQKETPALLDADSNQESWVNIDPPDKSPGIKRKPVGGGLSPQSSKPDLAPVSSFASNNPFRRLSGHAPGEGGMDGPNWGQESGTISKGKEPESWNVQPPSDHLSRTGPDSSTYNEQHARHASAETWFEEKPTTLPPMPQVAPPPPPTEPLSPFSRQPPLIPIQPEHDSTDNPWVANPPVGAPTPSPIPFLPSQKQESTYNDDLLDRGQQSGVVSLKDELETLPNAANTEVALPEEPSLLEEDDVGPPLPVRPAADIQTEGFDAPEGPPPPKPPRPTIHTVVPSDEDIAKMIEQRNETYQIKHFNWFDHTSRKLRRSAMLTQNKNGPCPLLALVNALILGAKDESQAALDEALRSREQVTLGLIIETLMDELLSRGYQAMGEVLPDVDELNHFLMRLRTGMNANPRFVSPAEPPPNLMDADDAMLNVPQGKRARQRLGTFEATPDMKLYGAFSVPLVHGWLPEAGSDAARAFARSAPTYEDAQALQFGEEELEYKSMNSGLSETEQNIWQDINSIKNFLKTFPTQLTPTGLEAVQSSISSGAFAIMFRNDHFSTIYKHPESGQLFTLITDAGYADRDEIIWESLVDISGKHNEFFSGDFMPVSHHDTGDQSSTHPTARRSSQLLSVDDAPGETPLSPQERQEQHDADFAMALQLQEEEEQRQRAERNRRRSGGTAATSTTPQRRPQTGNIPIPLRSQAEVRPAIPPRNSRASNPAVNRPADALVEDAPPAYEEAAKGRPYIPPVGSPLHPSAEPSPMNSNAQLTGTQLTGTVSNVSNASGSGLPDTHPPGPNAGRRPQGRRMSAYNETAQYYGSPQRLHPYAQGVGGGPSRSSNRQGQNQDRDCVVM